MLVAGVNTSISKSSAIDDPVCAAASRTEEPIVSRLSVEPFGVEAVRGWISAKIVDMLSSETRSQTLGACCSHVSRPAADVPPWFEHAPGGSSQRCLKMNGFGQRSTRHGSMPWLSSLSTNLSARWD